MRIVFGLMCAFLGFTGCMEEEKGFSSEAASEVQTSDNGEADISVVEVSQGTDAAIDEIEIDAPDATDADDVSETEVVDVDAEEVLALDEISGGTDAETSEEIDVETVDVVDSADVTETADSEVVDDIVAEVSIDATEVQDTQDTLDVSPEDADITIEIAEDVSVAVDVLDTFDTTDGVDIDATQDADVVLDVAADVSEVVDGEDSADASPDLAPDIQSEIDVVVDVPADVPPPDPCLSLNCDDKNPCTLDSCNPVTGCANKSVANSCDDGNACTVADVCAAGICAAGTAKNCNDGNLCTSDSCDPKVGCSYLKNSLACEDGDICTEGEKCSGGSCTAGQTKNCSDGNVCTSDSCDPIKGCVNAPMAGVCSDGNECTESDSCIGGICKPGSVKVCDDGNACTSNVCDVVKGCMNDPNWVLYDLEDAKLPPNWTLGGNMEVTCSLGNEFKTKCVFRVPQGAPAYTTSFAELELDKVRASYKMGQGDLSIQVWCGRFQFVNNMDTMMSSIVDAAGKNILFKVLDGATGTVVLQEFVVPKTGLLLRFLLELTEKKLLTGPAVWGRVLIAPVGCTPPVTP